MSASPRSPKLADELRVRRDELDPGSIRWLEFDAAIRAANERDGLREALNRALSQFDYIARCSNAKDAREIASAQAADSRAVLARSEGGA